MESFQTTLRIGKRFGIQISRRFIAFVRCSVISLLPLWTILGAPRI